MVVFLANFISKRQIKNIFIKRMAYDSNEKLNGFFSDSD